MTRAAAAIAAVIIAALAFGCASEAGGIYMRASVVQRDRSLLSAELVVEGSDGNCLNAANAVLESPGGARCPLRYDAEVARYTATIPSAGAGAYRFSAVSRAGDSSLVVPFAPVAAAPEIIGVSDGSGAEAFAGQGMDPSTAIAIAWEEVEGASAYVMDVAKAGQLALTMTVGSSPAIIEAGVLGTGTYAVSVEAQRIDGDILLRGYPYYSASTCRGAAVMVRVE